MYRALKLVILSPIYLQQCRNWLERKALLKELREIYYEKNLK